MSGNLDTSKPPLQALTCKESNRKEGWDLKWLILVALFSPHLCTKSWIRTLLWAVEWRFSAHSSTCPGRPEPRNTYRHVPLPEIKIHIYCSLSWKLQYLYFFLTELSVLTSLNLSSSKLELQKLELCFCKAPLPPLYDRY